MQFFIVTPALLVILNSIAATSALPFSQESELEARFGFGFTPGAPGVWFNPHSHRRSDEEDLNARELEDLDARKFTLTFSRKKQPAASSANDAPADDLSAPARRDLEELDARFWRELASKFSHKSKASASADSSSGGSASAGAVASSGSSSKGRASSIAGASASSGGGSSSADAVAAADASALSRRELDDLDARGLKITFSRGHQKAPSSSTSADAAAPAAADSDTPAATRRDLDELDAREFKIKFGFGRKKQAEAPADDSDATTATRRDLEDLITRALVVDFKKQSATASTDVTAGATSGAAVGQTTASGAAVASASGVDQTPPCSGAPAPADAQPAAKVKNTAWILDFHRKKQDPPASAPAVGKAVASSSAAAGASANYRRLVDIVEELERRNDLEDSFSAREEGGW